MGGDGNIGETSSMGAAAATAAAPSLDYTALTNRIEAFKELFVAHLNATATAMHEAQAEHVHNTHEAQRTLESVRDHIERQKNEQKALYQGGFCSEGEEQRVSRRCALSTACWS